MSRTTRPTGTSPTARSCSPRWPRSAWTGSSRRCASGWTRCGPATPQDRARRRLREAGRGYVAFALAEPGYFEVAFSTKQLPDELSDAESPASDVGDAEQTAEGPYALLGAALDELVDVGDLEPQRRTGADVTCWAAVHGFAELNLHGPLRSLPDEARDLMLEGLLDTIERGLTLRTAAPAEATR